MVLSKPVLLIRSQIGRIFLLPISQTLDFTSFICLMTSSSGAYLFGSLTLTHPYAYIHWSLIFLMYSYVLLVVFIPFCCQIDVISVFCCPFYFRTCVFKSRHKYRGFFSKITHRNMPPNFQLIDV